MTQNVSPPMLHLVPESAPFSEAQRAWLNGYHKQVAKTLSPLLKDAADKKWLTQACKPI